MKNLDHLPHRTSRSKQKFRALKYHLISNTKSISKTFIPNFVCFLTDERYKTYQTGFILSPRSCPRGRTWGYLGAKIKFRPAVCPLCYLLLNHWTKFNQIWCVSYPHEWGAQLKKIFGPAPSPGEGLKGQISFNFNLFQTLCVFSQMKDTKLIRRDFHYVALVMPQGCDFWELGVPRWSK